MLGSVRLMSVKDAICTGRFVLFQQALYFPLFSARA